MKNLLLLISVSLSVGGCSTVKTKEDGREYEIQCHHLFTSDESCAKKAENKCPKGYEIEDSVFKYVILKGPQRVVTIICK